MERGDTKTDGAEVRRSSRLSQNKGVFPIDLRPRGALKRKRNVTARIPSEEGDADEGSPDKMAKVQLSTDAVDGHENGDQTSTVEMDVEEHEDQNQDMNSEDESGNFEAVVETKPSVQEESVIRTVRVGNLETDEMRAFLQRQKKTNQMSQATKPPKLTGCGDALHGSKNVSRDSSTTGSASVKPKPLENKTDILTVRSSIREYRNKMEEKARGVSGMDLQGRDSYPYVKDHLHSRQPPSSLKKTPSLKTNNIPVEKQFLHHTNTAVRKKVITKTGSTSPSRDAWGVCRWFRWALFLLASLALGLMGYQHFPSSFKTSEYRNRSLYGATFEAYLGKLKTLFPSQRPELWDLTTIHITRHLNLTDPTEPVSLILTSGRVAEKTLGCLAQHLVTAFSSIFNSSVLSINGTSKSAQDSDQVKMDIDKALKEAFEGGTMAAVIHRFEELPPGSTLIFYRYCDHENSAFKKVFLAFTVMLEEDFTPNAKLGIVEEMVQEYIKRKFVSSNRTAKFNQMDVDKLGGLWSRISHLILPVASEQKIEQQGCWEGRFL